MNHIFVGIGLGIGITLGADVLDIQHSALSDFLFDVVMLDDDVDSSLRIQDGRFDIVMMYATGPALVAMYLQVAAEAARTLVSRPREPMAIAAE